MMKVCWAIVGVSWTFHILFFIYIVMCATL